MKFLSRSQVESLSRFRSDKFQTTSFFLDTDKHRLTKKEILVSAKNLLAEGRARLDGLDMAKEKKASLLKDLDAIHDYCAKDAASNSAGLAVYACSGAGFWEVLSLPEAPRSRVVFDNNPFVRPLSLILDEFHRLIAFLVDRREAKWYEVFMGEIKLLDEMKTEVPKKVKGGGEREEARRMERHVDAAVHDHYKKAAQKTFDLFKKNGFHGFVLGCPDNLVGEIEPVLHPFVRERLKGWLRAKPADAPDVVLKEVQALERVLKTAEEEGIVKKLTGELEKGGRARSGLKDSLRALNQGEVQTLVVSRFFAVPGKFCPRCNLLYAEDELKCPSCERKTEIVVDVVDEAIEAAMKRDGAVKHITPPSKLERYGSIGTLLRYKA
jgi:peptide subunit release factor 1 (eRF1)